MDSSSGLCGAAGETRQGGAPRRDAGADNALAGPITVWTRDVARQLGVEVTLPTGTGSAAFEAYLRALEELEVRAGGWPALERVVRERWSGWASHVGRRGRTQFGSPRGALAFLAGTLVPLVFPPVRMRVQEAEPHGMEVDAVLSSRGETFLRLLGLVMGLLLEQAGFRRPRVELAVEETHARYTYHFGPVSPSRVTQAAGMDQELQSRVEAACRDWGLSRRQADVVRLVFLGMSNKEIASRLGIVEGTVELHVTQVLRKAHVTSRAELLASLLAAHATAG